MHTRLTLRNLSKDSGGEYNYNERSKLIERYMQCAELYEEEAMGCSCIQNYNEKDGNYCL